MRVVVLKALNEEKADRCIGSLLRTAPKTNFNICLVNESGFREQTLNEALSLVGNQEDVLFVADDIEFTPGWHQALMSSYGKADILGMCMLYPGTNKVQDRGYDLIQIDERITLVPKDRGRLQSEFETSSVRSCSAVCGCFMFLKASVLKRVSSFKEEGQNRWGEFIFMLQARRLGATIGVIDHYLYHDGKSTKSNPDKGLSSISYHEEKKIWKSLVDKYVEPNDIAINIHSILDDQFRIRLEQKQRILFYGVGTVAEILLKCANINLECVTFCSGLPEESNIVFFEKRVNFLDEISLNEFDWIIITPLHIGEKLYDQLIRPRLTRDFRGQVSVVEMKADHRNYTYLCKNIHSQI